MDNPVKMKRRYRPYVCFGDSSAIPARTRRYWDRKRKLASTALQKETEQDDIDAGHTEQNKLNRNGPEPPQDDIHQRERETEPQFILPELEESQLDVDDHLRDLEVDDFLSNNDISENEFDREIDSDSSEDHSNENSNGDGNKNCKTDESSIRSEYSMDLLIRTLLVMATKIRHKLPYSAAEDILRLANVLTDSNGSQNTKYHWKKILNVLSNFLSVHRFCDRCHHYVGEEIKDACGAPIALNCQTCNRAIDMHHNWESGDLLIYLNLTDQLQQTFELEHQNILFSKVREKQNEYAIEDIFDGDLYRKNVADDMTSLNFNVDGTPIFDSSPISIYPVLCTVNELPPKKRGQHMMISCLWFGKGKPKFMNELLKPFVTEVQSLSQSGFSYTYDGINYVRKCRLLVGICDTIARPMVRTSTQFNGECGCGLCLHPGYLVPKGDGRVRVYPIDAFDNPFGEGLRTHQQTLIHAINKEKGIKGRAVLCDVDGFDIINHLMPDWMHAVALGLAKQFAVVWFDSSSHHKSYYLGRYVSVIDKIMESFKPTLEISRTPRKISERSYWKAHEWAIWLLFYSLPILNEIAPRKYVEHWSLLVDGLSILLQTSIMRSEVHYARHCFYEFVKGVKTLYGIEHVSFNVHLLTHLPDSVLKWGPLWTHSAFIYESFNHVLKTSVHSSNGVAMQVCDAFRHKYALHRLQNICEATMTYSQQKYVANMLQKRHQPKVSLSIDSSLSVKIIGKIHPVTTLLRPYYLALRGLDVPVDESQYIQLAQRIVINNEQIHCKKYTRPQKRASYSVLLKNGEVFEIEQFIILCLGGNSQCYAVGKYYDKTNVAAFKDRRLNHLMCLRGIHEDLYAVNVDIIKEKVTVIHMIKSKISFACIHPNHVELMT